MIEYIISKASKLWKNTKQRRTIILELENIFIQHIDFDENTAFPVVADPSFWQVTKCAGTVLWVIGTTIFTAAKIVKIKKAIKAAGGARKAAKGIIAAIKASKKLGGKWWTKINNTVL